jgi:amidase
MARAGAFDPDFGTATQALAALRRGAISSRELTAHVLARIDKVNPALNCFVTVTRDEALAAAKRADAQRGKRGGKGVKLGPLHGLPIVVKDTYATKGVRTTAGAKLLEQHVPEEDAVVVARLKAAGAVIVGKTNTPEWAADWQAFNAVAGQSNNPWDLTRTPGGSTGGGAAALAAGLGFLEVGSDIAGSIRVPSHFCGIYGHKPTWNVVPLRGHIPPLPGMGGTYSELPVAGPMARSAEDVLLELGVLAGPDDADAVGYAYRLPAPRGKTLRDYRIGYVLDDPANPVDSAMKAVLADAIAALRKAGARLTEGWPPGVDPIKQYQLYGWLLGAFFSMTLPDDEFERARETAAKGTDRAFTLGTAALHRDWLPQTGKRLAARATWAEYFKTHDAFLLPTAFVPAFPHDHSMPMEARTLRPEGSGERPYNSMSRWISYATLTGCPATTVPVGRTRGGLPVGLQIMGPFLEDATPLGIAAKVADVVGGFVPPPALGGGR